MNPRLTLPALAAAAAALSAALHAAGALPESPANVDVRTPTGPLFSSDTIAGPAVATHHGAVQVEIERRRGRLVDVRTLQAPDGDPRSRDVNRLALPALRNQAVASNGTRVEGVSGATLTADAYRKSLRKALELAAWVDARAATPAPAPAGTTTTSQP